MRNGLISGGVIPVGGCKTFIFCDTPDVVSLDIYPADKYRLAFRI